MYMRKHYIRPIIYLSLCAAIILIVFIFIYITGYSSASGLVESTAQTEQQTFLSSQD